MVKKISFKNGRNLTLVGSLWQASTNAIIIMAHGSGSNRFAKGLFDQVALALQKENYNVLAFDFSGCGESDDAIINIKGFVDDLTSAIAFVKEQGYTRIALLGHSLGTLACLEAFSSNIETMVLLGALTGPVDWKWEELASPEQIQDMYKKGYITSLVNDGLRKEVKVDAHLLQEIREIDQEEILKRVTCPVFIIHGDADKQELDLLKPSKRALLLLPKGSELKILPGLSHSFLEDMTTITALITAWYQLHFPPF